MNFMVTFTNSPTKKFQLHKIDKNEHVEKKDITEKSIF